VDDLGVGKHLLVAARGRGKVTVTYWWRAGQQLVATNSSPKNRVAGQEKGKLSGCGFQWWLSRLALAVMTVLSSATGGGE